jgi:hypothetical protein
VPLAARRERAHTARRAAASAPAPSGSKRLARQPGRASPVGRHHRRPSRAICATIQLRPIPSSESPRVLGGWFTWQRALLHLAISTLGALHWRVERLSLAFKSAPLSRSRGPRNGISLHSGTHRRRLPHRCNSAGQGHAAPRGSMSTWCTRSCRRSRRQRRTSSGSPYQRARSPKRARGRYLRVLRAVSRTATRRSIRERMAATAASSSRLCPASHRLTCKPTWAIRRPP